VAPPVVLVVVTLGHLLKEPCYPFQEHVVPRLALLRFQLVMPREEDRLSVDRLLGSHGRGVGGTQGDS
jgi:hypothetical protein